MDLLQNKINIKQWQIRTNLIERSKKKDRLPAMITGPTKNSVIGDECIIEGSVTNSILSPGVRVMPGAKVTDCIIFHDTTIGKHAQLKRVICDKDAQIGDRAVIGHEGEHIPSEEFKELLCSGISVIGRTINIPENTCIGANTVLYPSARISDKKIKAGTTLR